MLLGMFWGVYLDSSGCPDYDVFYILKWVHPIKGFYFI